MGDNVTAARTCPNCGREDSIVYDSRTVMGGRIQRRESGSWSIRNEKGGAPAPPLICISTNTVSAAFLAGDIAPGFCNRPLHFL